MLKNRKKPKDDTQKTILLTLGALDELKSATPDLKKFGEQYIFSSKGRHEYQAMKASAWRPSKQFLVHVMHEIFDREPDEIIGMVATMLFIVLNMYDDREMTELQAHVTPQLAAMPEAEKQKLFANCERIAQEHSDSEGIQIAWDDAGNAKVVSY
jgi:hypothetical protein